MKDIVLKLVLVMVATVAVVTTYVWYANPSVSTPPGEAERHDEGFVPAPVSTYPNDQDTSFSILDQLQCSLEIQPQWNQQQEFLLQVNVQKPVGKAYFVSPVENSFVLFVNNHPWATATLERPHQPAHQRIDENTGSHNPILRFSPQIPDGAKLFLEWINYNQKTQTLERLRTATITATVGG